MGINKTEIDLTQLRYKSQNVDLEGLIFKPNGIGPFPSVVFVHGHDTNGVGAWGSALMGYFLQKAGYVAFLPSQMGYTLSKGDADYCGPKTVQGIIDGVKMLAEESYVDQDRIGIWGVSRGAAIASIAIAKEPALFKAAVLQSGVYDMEKDFHQANKPFQIKHNIIRECKATKDALRERSSLILMNKITCPVLILHGEQDVNVNVEQAHLLSKELKSLGKKHRLVIVRDAGHFLTRQTRRKYTFPFLEKHLKNFELVH